MLAQMGAHHHRFRGSAFKLIEVPARIYLDNLFKAPRAPVAVATEDRNSGRVEA